MPLPALPRSGRRLSLALAVLLALALGGCQSDDGSTGQSRPGPARSAGGTSDRGSRFLDAGGPIGGLTSETPPVVGSYPAGAGEP